MLGQPRGFGTAARIAGAVIALIAAASLTLRVILATAEFGTIGAGLLDLSRFFTVLTNVLTLVFMLAVWAGRAPSGRLSLALVTAIAMVGIIYHLLLARLWSPQGWVMVADQGVHTIVPVLSVLWWFAFGRAEDVTRRDVAWVMVWPLVYCAYALVRGATDGTYPYPFLDLDQLGARRITLNVAGLAVAFLTLGALLRGIVLSFSWR